MMRRFDRVAGLGLLFVLCALAGASGADKPMAPELLLKLYFLVPFSIETYLPVTKDNIQEQGSSIWFLEKNPFMAKLRATLQSRAAKGQVLPGHIRLKAHFGGSGEVFFVDQKGTVLNEKTGATFTLTAKQVSELERELDGFNGVVDVKAVERRGGLKK